MISLNDRSDWTDADNGNSDNAKFCSWIGMVEGLTEGNESNYMKIKIAQIVLDALT